MEGVPFAGMDTVINEIEYSVASGHFCKVISSLQAVRRLLDSILPNLGI